MDPHGHLLSLWTFGHENRADFQTLGRDFLFRELLESLRVHRTITLLGRYFDPPFLAHFHPRKSLLQTGDDLVASLCILQRLFALVGFDGFAVLAGKRVLEA